MNASGFILFDTAIGLMAAAWRGEALTGLQLPMTGDGAARTRIARRFPGLAEAEPPAPVRAALDAVIALLGGEPRDLSDIALDMSATPAFDRRVYEAARAIPVGATLTYGELAARIGDPGAARAVGAALGRNPFPVVVPCHRVLAASGGAGGFSAPGGVSSKLRLLNIERAAAGASDGLFASLPLEIRPRF